MAELFVPPSGLIGGKEALAQRKEICSNINPYYPSYTIFPDETIVLKQTFGVGRGYFEQGRLKSTDFVTLYIIGCVDYQFSNQSAHHQTGFVYHVYRFDPRQGPVVHYALRIGVDVPASELFFEKNIIGGSGDYAY